MPEDEGIPETAPNLWRQVGFLRRASEFWHLARIMLEKIMSNIHAGDGFEESPRNYRYDHGDMAAVNELIVEYRRLNLDVNE